ncbi:MAG: hypothetical protein JSW28_01515 [Thermoplasmata archaeon]|nr:MAG: hypothetical protein JSW28_01515 [Thermoplasmata archaeon]
MAGRLLFVYNADSGIVSSFKDYFVKIIKPQAYRCNLCRITFGNIGMKSEWRKFVAGLPVPVQFLHRDEFAARYPGVKTRFPAAYINNDGELAPFITRDEMSQFKSLEELMEAVESRLKERMGS